MSTNEKTQKHLIADCQSCKFEKVQRKEGKNPYVICTLRGPCMEIGKKNRNNRIYSEELIRERILNNPDVKEKIKNKQLLGEGDHPEERVSVSYPMVALAVTDLWIPEDDKTHLWGEFDILPTTKGKDLAAIIDYSGTIGISARALGSHYINAEGAEVLEASDYDFITFDAVPDPGFAVARLSIKESLERDKEIYSEKSIKEIGVVLENYRSYTKSVSNASGAGLGSSEGVQRSELPKSVVESAKKLHNELRVRAAECEKLKSEKRYLFSQITEMQIGLDCAKKESEELKRLSESNGSKVKKTLEALRRLEKKNELYRLQMRRMVDDITILRNKMSSVQESLEISKNAKKELVGECELLRKRLSRTLDLHDSTKEELLNSVDSEQNALEKIAELKAKLSEYENAIDEKDSEIAVLKGNVSKLSNELDSSEDELRKSKDLGKEIVDRYETEIENLENKVESLNRQLRVLKERKSIQRESISSQQEIIRKRLERFCPASDKKLTKASNVQIQPDNAADVKRWVDVYKK